MASYESVRLETADGVATLTLNRPDRLNSFTVAMHGEVRVALDTVVADSSVRCLVLTGAGAASARARTWRIARSPRAARRSISAPRSITITSHCCCACAGCACRRCVRSMAWLPGPAPTSVCLRPGHRRPVGELHPVVLEAWPGPGLRRHVVAAAAGRARARDGTGTARRQALGPQAEEWGLIWRCVEDDELLPTAMAAARQLAAGPTRSYVRTREAMEAGLLMPFEAALDLERDYQRELGRSDDYREGVTAFMEKRAPRFKGQ